MILIMEDIFPMFIGKMDMFEYVSTVYHVYIPDKYFVQPKNPSQIGGY